VVWYEAQDKAITIHEVEEAEGFVTSVPYELKVKILMLLNLLVSLARFQ